MSAPRAPAAGPLLDRAAIRRHHDRASASYDAAAELAARLREAMVARLDWIAVTPDAVLDLGCGTGHGAVTLAERWPRARVIALDASGSMLREADRRAGSSRIEWLQGQAESLPLPDASVDCVFSNLALPWCEDIDAVFAEVARVLRPRGLFTFTTLGPDTLIELRAAFRAADDAVHVHPFADMHDLGDGLVRAGLAEPVLDVSRYTLTYPDLESLMRELKAAGAQNAASHRPRGLTGRGRMRRVAEAYERHRAGGVLPASFEAVFGQAWGALPHARRERDAPFLVPVDAIGRREPPR
jgi:malonyl-CoA O-methyltransferase